MKKTCAEIEGEVLTVVAGHSYLSFELFLGFFQLRNGQGRLHELIKFASDEAQAAVDIVWVAAEIDSPQSRIAVTYHRAFHGVDKSVALAQGQIGRAHV